MKTVLSLCSIAAVGLSQKTTVLYEDVRDRNMLEFQWLATADSYHVRPDPYVPKTYFSFGSLEEQLDSGVRGFFFDLWPDHADRYEVYHDESDPETLCDTIEACLGIVFAWMQDNHRDRYFGEPIYIGLEPQNPDDWTAQHVNDLGDHVRDVINNTYIYGPLDLGANPNNESERWPDWTNVMMSDLEYKVIITYNGRHFPEYAEAGTILPSQLPFFHQCRRNDQNLPYCVFFAINNIDSRYDDIFTLSKKYPVKCRPDIDFIEVAGVEFSPKNYSRGEWDATFNPGTGEITISVEDWQAWLLFNVIDKDNNDIATWNETYDYVVAASEGNEARIDYAEANVKPISPIAAADYALLAGLGVELYGSPNVDLNATLALGELGIKSGCQILQTQHVIINLADPDDYYFNLGCDGVTRVEFLYNGTDCVQFPTLAPSTEPTMRPTGPEATATTDSKDAAFTSKPFIYTLLLFVLYVLF